MNRFNETIKVLVLEGDPSFARLIESYLKANGFESVVVKTAGEARLAFAADPDSFDLLITHVVMPLSNGLEFAASLLRSHPHLKVLYTSDKAHSELFNQRLLPIPQQAFLRKPFEHQMLNSKIAKLFFGT